jgi:hypothetical protein
MIVQLNLATWRQIEKKGAEISKGIFLEKIPPRVAIFGGKKELIAPHLDHGFFMSLVYRGFSKKNLVFSLTCSQIWLSPLLDDHHSTYITKLGGKKKKKKKPPMHHRKLYHICNSVT